MKELIPTTSELAKDEQDVADRMHRRRDELGMSEDDLADALGATIVVGFRVTSNGSLVEEIVVAGVLAVFSIRLAVSVSPVPAVLTLSSE